MCARSATSSDSTSSLPLPHQFGTLSIVYKVASRTLQIRCEEAIMSQENGVCAIVPSKQDGLNHVVGMGILVAKREVVTCAHVITALLGENWQSLARPVVHVFFPFAPGMSRLGVADKSRYVPEESRSGKITDVAVIVLDKDAPSSVGLATLREHVVDSSVKLFGFPRQELSDGSWQSHPKGRTVAGTLIAPLPGGRVQFNGRQTKRLVTKGYSGAGLYDPKRACVVGMIVELDTDGSNTGRSGRRALLGQGRHQATSPSALATRGDAKRTVRKATFDQVIAKKREIEDYLRKITDLLPAPAPGSRFVTLLKELLNAADAPAPILRSAFGFPEDSDASVMLVTIVSSSEVSMLPVQSVLAERLDQLLSRLGFTLAKSRATGSRLPSRRSTRCVRCLNGISGLGHPLFSTWRPLSRTRKI